MDDFISWVMRRLDVLMVTCDTDRSVESHPVSKINSERVLPFGAFESNEMDDTVAPRPAA